MCLFGINISVGPEIMLSLPVWLSNLYDSSISLLECKMQIFRKIRHFIYANNGKPTRPWKKVLVKVTSMHLTFDQAGFFSRADEARGKKIYECKWTCNMPPHFTARLCTIIGLQYYIVKKTMDDRGSHTQHVGQLSQQICMKDLTNTKFMWFVLFQILEWCWFVQRQHGSSETPRSSWESKDWIISICPGNFTYILIPFHSCLIIKRPMSCKLINCP